MHSAVDRWKVRKNLSIDIAEDAAFRVCWTSLASCNAMYKYTCTETEVSNNLDHSDAQSRTQVLNPKLLCSSRRQVSHRRAPPGCVVLRLQYYGCCSKNLPFRAIAQQVAAGSGCCLYSIIRHQHRRGAVQEAARQSQSLSTV